MTWKPRCSGSLYHVNKHAAVREQTRGILFKMSKTLLVMEGAKERKVTSSKTPKAFFE